MPIVNLLRRLQLPLLLLALAFSSAVASAVTLTSQEQAIFNDLKASARPFIVVDPILTQVARNHARDMAVRHYFDHVNPDGIGPDYMVQQAGYILPDNYGTSKSVNYIESIAAGETSASATWSDWMNSAPHKKHLMAEDSFYAAQTSVGVGYYADPSSQYGYYWVVITAPPQPTPSLTVTSPSAGAQVSGSQVAVAGQTGGTTTTASVVFRVENANGTGAFVTASGIASWSGVATGLIPGPNVIRFRSLDATGATIAEATRSVAYIVKKPLTVNVSGQGSVTAAFAGTTQRALGYTYTIAATPAPGNLFTGWSGSSSSKSATLTFRMVEGYTVTANFAPNPFTAKAGAYRGLLQNGATGILGVTVGPAGGFTGHVNVNGTSYALAGRFGLDGSATVSLPSGINLSLRLDLSGNSGVSASISGSVTASATAGATYRTANGDYPHAGRYTVLLPPNPQSTDATLPQGNGYGTLIIGKAGRATLTGALPDGRTFTATSYVEGNDQLPFYVPLSGAGSLIGTATVRDSGVSDLDGTFHWSSPANPAARIHPAALEADLPLIGSKYTAPAAGQPVFQVTASAGNSAITLEDGNLAAPIVQPCTLDVANRLTPTRQAVAGLRAGVNPVAGIFAGTFIHPVTQLPTAFRGVIFQRQNAGYGYFLGTSQSGSASLAPQ